mgnify:CR=1 FL=1
MPIFQAPLAISYIANKIRQGDRENSVDIIEVDGTSVLQLKQQVGEEKYHTWIYWKDGSIRELFTDENSGLGLDDGLENTGMRRSFYWKKRKNTIHCRH